MPKIDPKLYEFATVRQLELLEAIDKHGSYRRAATALGITKGTLDTAIARVRGKAALAGHAPAHDMVHTVPDGYMVKGVSSLYDKDGKLSAQWVKSSADAQRRAEMHKAALDAMCEEIVRIPALAAPAGGATAPVQRLHPHRQPCWHAGVARGRRSRLGLENRRAHPGRVL